MALPVPGVISLTTSSVGGVAAASIAMVGSLPAAPVTVTPSAVVVSPAAALGEPGLDADGVAGSPESEEQPVSTSAGTAISAAAGLDAWAPP